MTAITSSLSLTNIVWGFSPHEGLETTTVSVTASGAWTLTSTQPWIRLGQTSGTGNATAAVTIAPLAAFPQESVGAFSRVRQGTYTATLTLTEGSNTAMCAVNYSVGYGDQLGTSVALQPVAPAISPNGGTISGSQIVTLSAPAGKIYFTVDGSEPSPASLLYSGPFTITTATFVQAIAVNNFGWSSIASAAFVT
jgi:hypothetical protein